MDQQLSLEEVVKGPVNTTPVKSPPEDQPGRFRQFLYRALYFTPDLIYITCTGKTRNQEVAQEQTGEASQPSLKRRIARRALYEVFDNTKLFIDNLATTPRRLRDPATRRDKDIAYTVALVAGEIFAFCGTFAGAWIASNKFGLGPYSSALLGGPVGNYIAGATSSTFVYYALVHHHFKSLGEFGFHFSPILLKNIPLALVAYTLDALPVTAMLRLGASPVGPGNISYFITSGLFVTLSNVINARSLQKESYPSLPPTQNL